MALKTASHLPTATYRFQLHKDFPFKALQALIPYLDDLGVSDCYLSPITRAVPGSLHGYDVSDAAVLNPELGGEEGFRSLAADLKERDMGCLVDFVPNHMGIASAVNRWWFDVLENGRQSRYAHYFDIEWYPRHQQLRERVLVPMLGDYYGRLLENGELRLTYAEGSFAVAYGEGPRFPVRPEHVPQILTALETAAQPALENAAQERLHHARSLFQILPQPADREAPAPQEFEERERLLLLAKEALAALLEGEPALAAALEEVLRDYNGRPGDARSFDRLHALLDDQNYRLAFWKTGAHETNYRRFFAIDTLVGLRVEEMEVMRATHALLASLIAEGLVRGVRLDHIDGLWNPTQYLQDFQALCTPPGGGPLYALVEKILAPGETLPSVWPIHGATGYEFIPQLADVLVDGSAAPHLTETYERFTGITATAADTVYEKKRFVLEELFANAIGNLAIGLDRIIEYDRRWRDLTMHDLRVAVRETMACLSVYRTYRQPGFPSGPADGKVLREACEEAKRRNRCLDPLPFDFVHEVLRGAYHEDPLAGLRKQTTDDWTLKFQQATGAVMAKSVEDTSFYVYVRFFGLNEVGGEIGRLGAGTVEEFHAANARRLAEEPQGMLTTSTHDTKVSEDVRARLYALSERPGRWREILGAWSAHNRPFKTVVDGRLAPDANEEYLLYQVLLGAWAPGAEEADADFVSRMKGYMRKAVSEAKVNTNWVYPNEAWLAAVENFVERILAPAGRFLPLFLPEARLLAEHGMVNSLAQTTLKLAAPGMPDIYQGNEVWDFSLVDPDNRRPIDFAARQALLSGLAGRTPEDLLSGWQDGGIKLHLTRTLLQLRRRFPALFQQGEYRPVLAEGPLAEHVVAFTRAWEGKTLTVAVPRLPGNVGLPPVGEKWRETRLLWEETDGVELFTGRPVRGGRLSEWLAAFPCAAVLGGI
ncbi:MAG: malto-oligosyltrehalose synthase [Verrucomicrobium sp.]|nr:malto-oligosyltrehalose synthase [Verrucomicrobium sp.]